MSGWDLGWDGGGWGFGGKGVGWFVWELGERLSLWWRVMTKDSNGKGERWGGGKEGDEKERYVQQKENYVV